jgi:hypothetical protein
MALIQSLELWTAQDQECLTVLGLAEPLAPELAPMVALAQALAQVQALVLILNSALEMVLALEYLMVLALAEL